MMFWKKVKPVILTKEQTYLKKLEDIEKIVKYCKEMGFVTKKDWEREGIKMNDVVLDFIKSAKDFNNVKRKEAIGYFSDEYLYKEM